jgi:hypothetical protein
MNRTRSHVVTFNKPFNLDEIEAMLPAGPYRIETEEAALEGLSFLAWRRISTHIMINSSNGSRMEAIDPAGLESALHRDQAQA